jgi:UDP-N-acetylglucosamine 2-epimerase (non-hydrolysing)
MKNIGKNLDFNNKYKFIRKSSTKIFSKNFLNLSKHSKIIVLLFIALFLLSSPFLSSELITNNCFLKKNINKFFIPHTYRIAFVFGTRPEAIKLFPLIKELKKDKEFICITINTGQHKEMIKQILNYNNLDNLIDFNLNLMKKNQSLSKLTSRTISELEDLYKLIHPNAVIVQGDTTTAFSAAISAFYQKIPIFHVEAGLRTHNLFNPFPEEFNRITIDDISTLYFAPTEWSASNLLKENKQSDNIFITGNTIVDSLKITLKKTSPSIYIRNLIKRVKLLCMPNNDCKIILLTCHRRENYFKPIFNILNAVQQLLKKFSDIAIIFPFHLNPNVKHSIKEAIPNLVYDDIIKGKKIEIQNFQHLNRFIIIPPLDYVDLIHLESSSYFIMSDSGGIQEEAVSIGKPLLILREHTERPEAVKYGCSFLVGTSFEKIYHYSSSLLTNNFLYDNISKSQNIYGYGNSSIIISKIIKNYFDRKNDNSNLYNAFLIFVISQLIIIYYLNMIILFIIMIIQK